MALCEHAPLSRPNLLKPVIVEVHTVSRTTDAKRQSSTTEDNAEDPVLKTFFSGYQPITGGQLGDKLPIFTGQQSLYSQQSTFLTTLEQRKKIISRGGGTGMNVNSDKSVTSDNYYVRLLPYRHLRKALEK